MDIASVSVKIHWQSLLTNFTCQRTFNASVIPMATVMPSPTVMTTTGQILFTSSTCDVIQPYLSCSINYLRTSKCPICVSISKLTTYNCGIIDIPIVITYCSPLSVIKYLHTTCTIGTWWSLQSDGASLNNYIVRKKCTVISIEINQWKSKLKSRTARTSTSNSLLGVSFNCIRFQFRRWKSSNEEYCWGWFWVTSFDF